MSLFLIVCIVWIVSEIFLNRLVRSNQTDKQQADKNTLLYIWIAIAAAICSAIYVSARVPCPISVTHAALIEYTGLALIALGVVVRLLVIKSLGRFFTVDVTIRQGHKLKTDGFYKYIRHPSYSASLLSFIGFGLTLNNWISLGIITVLIFVSFARRIYVEENVLTQQFGDEYAAYRQRTKRLVPFVY